MISNEQVLVFLHFPNHRLHTFPVARTDQAPQAAQINICQRTANQVFAQRFLNAPAPESA
jgi:hypothetical protein